MVQRRLGRGLDFFLSTGNQAADGERVEEVELTKLVPNPHQPRREFSPKELEELAASIRSAGLLQPLTSTGFRIGFTKPINKTLATKADSYDIRHWGYHYHPKYGSPKVDQKQETPTAVKMIDAKTVDIKVNLVTKRVYQLNLDKIKCADGTALTNATAWYTLNRTR